MQSHISSLKIYETDAIPQTEECQLGVVVSMNIRGNDQCHCGLAYDMPHDTKILHLATDKDVELSDDLQKEHFLIYVCPNLHPIRRKAFNEYLKEIGEEVKNGYTDIGYGFLYDEWAYFDKEHKLQLGANEIGLTCATYVLTLFHSGGFNLVDIDNWPARKSDNDWFDRIISYFKTSGMTEERFEKLKVQKGAPRYHPEEVAVASGFYDNQPAQTKLIWHEGQKLWWLLKRIALMKYIEKQQRAIQEKIRRK